MSEENNQFMTVMETAQFLRLTRGSVYAKIKAGFIPAFAIGGSNYRIPKAELLERIAAETRGGKGARK